MRLDLSLRNVALFLAAAFLFAQAHEFSHHLAVRAVCGSWGEMRFGLFQSASCESRYVFVPTIVGPLFTDGMILLGAWLTLRGRAAAGIVLIFANLPLGRIASALTRGDEMVVATQFLAPLPARIVVVAVTASLLLPPLFLAFRGLARDERNWAFPLLLVGPLVADAVVKRMVLDPLLVRFQPAAWIGVPWPVFAFDALLAALLLAGLRPGRSQAVPA